MPFAGDAEDDSDGGVPAIATRESSRSLAAYLDVLRSGDTFEDDVPGQEIWFDSASRERPYVTPGGINCVGPPARISASRSRQCEAQEVFDLLECQNDPVSVTLGEVFVQKRVTHTHAHGPPALAIQPFHEGWRYCCVDDGDSRHPFETHETNGGGPCQLDRRIGFPTPGKIGRRTSTNAHDKSIHGRLRLLSVRRAVLGKPLLAHPSEPFGVRSPTDAQSGMDHDGDQRDKNDDGEHHVDSRPRQECRPHTTIL